MPEEPGSYEILTYGGKRGWQEKLGREVVDLEQVELFKMSGEGDDNPPAEKRGEDRGASLDKLEKEVRECRKCQLREGCRQVVFGEGDPGARLMLVGEGPGSDEDRLGRPFVGNAGKLLDKILEAVNIRRPEVYITNVVKCRPPGNRTPLPVEVETCFPHLQAQLEIIRPEILVSLGNPASKALIDPGIQITKIRGRWIDKGGMKIMPTFHPAALLRDPKKKKLVWVDIQEIEKMYRKIE